MMRQYLSGTKWLPEHVNIILEEFQRDPRRYLKNSSARLGRSRQAVVKFVTRAGGIGSLFVRGNACES